MHSPEWIREALKQYFVNRPGCFVDTLDLMAYFRVASVLDAAEDLVRVGWLIRTGGPFPKLCQAISDDLADREQPDA
jgi:hypothetical protein